MALTTYTKVFSEADSIHQSKGGGTMRYCSTAKGPASYTTGGETMDLTTDISMSGTLVTCDLKNNDGSGAYYSNYDYTNNKLLFFVSATGVEVSSGTDLSGLTVRLSVVSHL